MPDFTQRSDDIEIMDDLNCSGPVVHQTLRELETINDLLGGNYVTIDGVAKLLENASAETVHIHDLGCGSGDMLRRIRRWAEKKNLRVQLTGIDANPNIVAYARQTTPAECDIEYKVLDIFSPEFANKNLDIVIGTLFFHHFTDQQLTRFFAQLKGQARMGVIINDIHRHRLAYYSIKFLTAIFSKSSMVKYDAPLSVLRAFKKNELKKILEQAGIERYSLRWMWAFRWQVIIWA